MDCAGLIRVNYYEHHLGDWAAATGHLTWDEDMAYTRLLRAYYHHEKAIPEGQQYRLAKASTPAQRKAVDQVLAEFFDLRDGHHHQKRADAEITRYREKEPDREAKKDNERERQRRTRERRKELFNLLRESGIVPAYDAPMHELQTLASRVMSRDVTQPVTRDITATQHQTPDTRHQTPNPEQPPPRTPEGVGGGGEALHAEAVEAAQPTAAGAVCRALRQAGMADTNPGHPRLLALLDAGATEAEFTGFAPQAIAKGAGFAWVLGAVEGERKRAKQTAELAHQGVMPQAGLRGHDAKVASMARFFEPKQRASGPAPLALVEVIEPEEPRGIAR